MSHNPIPPAAFQPITQRVSHTFIFIGSAGHMIQLKIFAYTKNAKEIEKF